jgi:hypothetical protein
MDISPSHGTCSRQHAFYKSTGRMTGYSSTLPAKNPFLLKKEFARTLFRDEGKIPDLTGISLESALLSK